METLGFFQCLPGRWDIRRCISNHGRMRGEATFKSIPTEANTLHYQEKGWLTLDGSERILKCYREYVYRYRSISDAIFVYFLEAEIGRTADRLFHKLRFVSRGGALVAQATHHCRSDIYQVTYELIDNDNFKVTYRVRGPNKDYVSDTSFQRKRCLPKA